MTGLQLAMTITRPLMALLVVGALLTPGRASAEPASDFTLRDINGQSVSLSEQRGNVVIMSFWATWCGPCREETPDFVEMQAKYGDGVRFLGVALEQDTDAVQDFADTYGVNYPILVDTDGEIVKHYPDVFGLPTTLLLDGEGTIRKRWVGQVMPDDLEPLLHDLGVTEG